MLICVHPCSSVAKWFWHYGSITVVHRLELLSVNPRSQGIGIAKDKLVMLLAERSSNLWMTVIEP